MGSRSDEVKEWEGSLLGHQHVSEVADRPSQPFEQAEGAVRCACLAERF